MLRRNLWFREQGLRREKRLTHGLYILGEGWNFSKSKSLHTGDDLGIKEHFPECDVIGR